MLWDFHDFYFQKMKELGLPLSFIDLGNYIVKDSIGQWPNKDGFANWPVNDETISSSDYQTANEETEESDNEEGPKDTSEFYEKPVLDYDTEFSGDVETMKSMGLPLGFCNMMGHEDKIPQFQITKAKSHEKSKAVNVSSIQIGKPQWQPVQNESDRKFQEFWAQNGEQIVMKKWKELYGDYMEKSEDSKEPQDDTKVLVIFHNFTNFYLHVKFIVKWPRHIA